MWEIFVSALCRRAKDIKTCSAHTHVVEVDRHKQNEIATQYLVDCKMIAYPQCRPITSNTKVLWWLK